MRRERAAVRVRSAVKGDNRGGGVGAAARARGRVVKMEGVASGGRPVYEPRSWLRDGLAPAGGAWFGRAY